MFNDDMVLAWVLIPPLNFNPAIFSVPPGAEKLNKSPQAEPKCLKTIH